MVRVLAQFRPGCLCALTAIAGLVGGCGGSSGGGDASRGAAAANADCMAAAKRNVKAAMAPMRLAPLEPFDASALKGKKFAIVQLSAKSAISTANAKGFKDALATVGATSVKYDGKGTPDLLAQGFQSAIGQGVAGIIADGFDPALVKTAVAAAKAANIPVVNVGANAPDAPLMDGVVANIAADGKFVGTIQADYALADTNCDLHAATFFVSAGPLTVAMAEGAEAEIKRLCPSCKLDAVDVNAATYSTTMVGQVRTTLQRAPDMNYLITTTDFFVPYLQQGSKAVGREVPFIGGAQGDGLAAAIEGNGVKAGILWPPGELTGWYYADAIMRAASGSVKSMKLPVRLVDASTWGTSADERTQFPELAGYQDTFKRVWGL